MSVMKQQTVEIVVPCYNEEKCIELFYGAVKEVFDSIPDYRFRITFVDDGSIDGTLEAIHGLRNSVEEGIIQFISFSRNFGKEAAIYAGLENSTGDYVVLMDVDLQHPPTLIPEMLKAVEEEGYDCATARRFARGKESKIRKSGSNVFYKLFNRITGMNLSQGSTDFRLMDRSVVEAIKSMPERERFTKGIYSWIGFKNKWIDYRDVDRAAGTTKWSTRGLVKYAWNGFIAFSKAPLRAVIYFGMLIVVAAVISAIIVFVVALKNGTSSNGFATIMIALLAMGGIIITILGIIGEYIARIYMEVKNRPIYIVREAEVSNNEDTK